ncbi:tetratricopeptide repeat protein [Francisella sp. SYW-2]|uniref:tetratricopeptide repeat protein n=1 Tax=Francisella sp. SYW-2 TaxID=2610886 RepID=UPI00123C84E3|nr:SEL1-like repeat protein [Francisella sp. SYW-2]
MKLKNKLLLSTLLIGISTYSFASMEDCTIASLKKDYDKAIEECLPYAEKDNIDAQVLITNAYAQIEDYKNALKYGLKVDNYYSKKTVPTNKNELKSYTGTLTGIGNIYYFGQAGKADKTKGLEYITRAANLGNNFAQNQLGDFYASKDEFPGRNLATAYKWYEIAVDQSYDPAKNGVFMTNLPTITQQAPYCIAMGEQLVAEAYIDGSAGLPKDNSKAKEYLNQAIALYQDNKPTAENTKYCPTGADKLNLESAKKELDSL